MNFVIWMLAGATLGWVGFKFLDFNEHRGMVVAMIIGAAGGLVGGKLIAPMFASAAAVPDAFSTSALLVAAFVAAAFLYAGNFVHDRWGV